MSGNEKTATLKQLERLIQKTSRAIARLIDAYEDGLLGKDEFEPRIRASKQRSAELQKEQASTITFEAERHELCRAIDHLQEFHKKISENLTTIDCTTKREIIRSLVKRVQIDKDNARIIYKVGPPLRDLSRSSPEVLQDCSPRAGRLF